MPLAALLGLRGDAGAASLHSSGPPGMGQPCKRTELSLGRGQMKERLDAAGDSGERRRGRPLFAHPDLCKAWPVAQLRPASSKNQQPQGSSSELGGRRCVGSAAWLVRPAGTVVVSPQREAAGANTAARNPLQE